MKLLRRVLIALVACGTAISGNQPAPLVITNVTVIDATGAPPRSDMTVVVSGDRITTITESRRFRMPKAARQIDGSGRYLIPGLWDMHVHFWFDEAQLELYVANGVTEVRDMGSPFERTSRLRDEVRRGNRVGPRIFTSGVPLDGSASTEPHIPIRAVSSTEDARAAVRELKEKRVDFVKVLSGVSSEVFDALVSEATRLGLGVAGHVPDSISAGLGSDRGMKSIEHLFGISVACAKDGDRLRAARNDAIARKDGATYSKVRDDVLDAYDATAARQLFARFVKNSTWQTPTLTMLQRMYYQFDADPKIDSRNALMPVSIRKTWGDPVDEEKNLSAGARSYTKKIFARSLQLTASMQGAGVGILAGTDTGDPFTYPGATLHDELALLVRAGLTPMEALQAATRNPARFLNLDSSLGTVEKGKLADLVLLSANPLDDIYNTRRIEAVIVSGVLIDKKQLGAFANPRTSEK